MRRALKRDKKRRAENAQKILDSMRDLIEACEAEGLPPRLFHEGVFVDIDGDLLAAYKASDISLFRRLIRERFQSAIRQTPPERDLYMTEQAAQRIFDAFAITKEERLAAHPCTLGEFLVTRRGLSPEEARAQFGAIALSMLDDGVAMFEEREQ